MAEPARSGLPQRCVFTIFWLETYTPQVAAAHPGALFDPRIERSLALNCTCA